MEWKVQTTPAQRAKRSTRPAHSQGAPFSPVAARLIEQIQAEARTALLAELSAKDSITVLHDFEHDTKRVYFQDADHLSVRDSRGNETRLHRNRFEPESWRDAPHMAGYWHPARWLGSLSLVDASGVKWERSLDVMVCDDFGNLVQVEA